MMAAFSTDASSAIQRKLNVAKVDPDLSTDFEDIYEIERCVNWIREHRFQKVALQFPDELLSDSYHIQHSLQTQIQADVCILADTSYGSCCVDEIAAEHYNADCIVHYGHSCLSPTQRLPVLYVFGHKSLDVTHCCQALQRLITDVQTKLLVLYDVVYSHAIDELEREMSSHFKNVTFSKLTVPTDDLTMKKYGMQPKMQLSGTSTAETTEVKFGRRFQLPADCSMEDLSFFYIGPEGSTLTNFMMSYSKSPFFTYNPSTKEARKESVNVNKLLMKRYYLIERAKDANIIGILVGTLGVSDYLQSIARVKSLVKKAGKKSYTFVVGKLNVAKLANFAEVDIFVLVACSENSLLDSSEFYKPVITPYEMEMACNPQREWSAEFVADFRELLPGGSSHVEIPKGDQEVVRDVSLITGGMRSVGIDKSASDGDKKEITTLANLPSHNAGTFLGERFWQGLDPKLGKTEVSVAVEGAKGTASSYAHELS